MASLLLAARLPDTYLRRRANRLGPAAGARLLGPMSVVAGSASLQAAAALATTLFAAYGAVGTGALRFSFAAVLLLVLVRPRLRRRDRRTWMYVVAFGGSMVLANLCLFQALAQLPLGTAVTLQFLGPLALALLAARRKLDLACGCAAAGGVVLLTGGLHGMSASGAAYALGAAAAVALSVVAGDAVGRRAEGFEGLALAVSAAALVTLPPAVPAVLHMPRMELVATAAVVGALGIALPYGLFFAALRRVGARTYSVLLSLDPAVALLVGILLLGQVPGRDNMIGIGLVVAASALAVGTRKPS